MQHSRLKWITVAIEYDRLTRSETAFLYNFVEKFMEGKLTTKADEERLESLFAEVQWREIEKEDLYAIWNKKEENKESVPFQRTYPEREESVLGALS